MSFLFRAARRRRRAGSATPSLSAQVEAILAGTTGFALDRFDTSTLWQDTAATVAVTTPSDPVGRINAKWGAAPPNWQQATAAQRPAYVAGGMTMDGVDDRMETLSLASFTNNIPALFACERITVASLAAISTLWFFAHGVNANQSRFAATVNVDGSITFSGRRDDAGLGAFAVTSAAGLITAGVPATVAVQADYAGSGLAKIWLNGTEVGSGSIGGSLGNTDATNPLRLRDGCGSGGAGGNFFNGTKRRSVFVPFAVSAGQRASCEGWVAE